jgi:hypothetical protein
VEQLTFMWQGLMLSLLAHCALDISGSAIDAKSAIM